MRTSAVPITRQGGRRPPCYPSPFMRKLVPALAVAMAAGCGYTGDPLPPLANVPAPVTEAGECVPIRDRHRDHHHRTDLDGGHTFQYRSESPVRADNPYLRLQ